MSDMRIIIDTEARTLTVEGSYGLRALDLYSTEAFEIISEQWLKVGWDQKYSYAFSWMGRPIIQLPEDLVRIQEVICSLRPDVIVETGVAHGGSLIFYASLCEAMHKGRVIGVDIEIRPPSRAAIESHEMSNLISLIEGNSIAPDIVDQVKSFVRAGESVLVVLDSCHSREHVLCELEAYCDLVTPGSYMVATDGIMKDLGDVPKGNPGWAMDNPAAAAIEFARRHPEFEIVQPPWPFNESQLSKNITHWPSAYLQRKLRS